MKQEHIMRDLDRQFDYSKEQLYSATYHCINLSDRIRSTLKGSIEGIIVPKGQEYQAVCRAIERSAKRVPILAIPVGTSPTRDYLTKLLGETARKPLSNFLLCGLCGSLSPQYNIGDVLIYTSYTYNRGSDPYLQLDCDAQLIEYVRGRIKQKTFLIKGLTSDRVVCSASVKRSLAEKYRVEAIDMEGFVVQKTLQDLINGRLATIRIVSDDSNYDLPDLSKAIDSNGNIAPIPLTVAMLKQPLAATRLISGSLRGLKVLEKVITELFA